MEKLSFLLRAPVLTLSGYGVHARQVARYVFENADKHNLDITTELLDWGTTPWITDIYAYDGLIGEIIQSTNNKKQFYDISVQLQLPHEWDHKKAKYNVGITAGIETDRCKPEWIDCINKMEKLW
jgi:phosphoribulokinase